MKKLNIYTLGKNEKVATINVKNVYEPAYCCNMPIIGKNTCKKILNNLYPHCKADGVELVFEYENDGYVGAQKLFRSGTILNF